MPKIESDLTRSAFLRRAYTLAGVFTLVIVLLIALTLFQSFVNSGIRIFTQAEGIWAKAQKEAVITLGKELTHPDLSMADSYDEAIQIPLGYRVARESLSKPQPDLETARRGFLQGKMHEDDVDTASRFFVYFYQMPYFSEAVEIWTEGDQKIAELEQLAETVLFQTSAISDNRRLNELRMRLHRIDSELTGYELAFSQVLAKAARDISFMLTLGIILISLIAVGYAAYLSLNLISAYQRVFRSNNESLKSLVVASEVAGLATYRFNLTTGTIETNSAAKERYGVPKTRKLVWEDVSQAIHPEDRESVNEVLRQHRRTLKPFQIDFRIISKSGLRHLRANGNYSQDPSGEISCLVAELDITTEVERNNKLLRNRRQTEMAARAAGCGFWSYFPKSHDCFWDSQLYQIWGLDHHSINRDLSTIWLDSIHPDDIERVVADEEALLLNGKPGDNHTHQYRINHPKLGVRWIEASYTIEIEPDSEETYLHGMSRDITEEKRRLDDLVNAQRQVNLALKTASISMIEINLSNNLCQVVGGQHPILGAGQVMDLDQAFFRNIKSDTDIKRLTSALNTDNDHLVYRVHYEDSDLLHWISVQTSERYLDGNDWKRLVVRTDVTPQYAANAKLELAAERQREMFAIIGHELRTPVASVHMLTQDTEIDGGEKLRLIDEISLHLLNVLDDLRLVVAPERVQDSAAAAEHISSLVTRTLGPLNPLLREHQLNLNINLPKLDTEKYRVHGQALRQLLTNLVKNAAIHSRGSQLWVSLEYLGEGNERCVSLTVEDDGRGIDPEKAESLFEAFRRGDTDADGSGLGLYIARELCTSLDGSIEYARGDQGGAKFTVRFPAVPDNENSATYPVTDESPGQLSDKRILLAEDDKTIRMLTEKILNKAGAKVTSCENGRIAAQRFEPGQFDLVLTDIMMPEMNGYQLTEEIRKRDQGIPVIAVTAAVVGKETDEILALGATAAIAKPFKLEKLLALL